MPEVVDQIRRYGEALERAVEPTDVQTLVARGARPIVHGPAPGRRRPPRRVWWAVAAAATVAVGVGGAALLGSDRGDGPSPTSIEVTGPTTSEDAFGYGPGWYDLDPGPLEPRSGGASVWTGDELVVLGGERHADGAAYDPVARRWRRLPPSPLPAGVPEVVWTGEEVVAVVTEPERLVGVVAAYDPDEDAWRTLGEAPPPAGPRLPGLVWTGDRVVVLASLATLDPATREWDDLLAPGVPFPYSPWAAWAWTGEELVIAEPGHDTLVHRPRDRRTRLLPAPPDPSPGVRLAAAAVAVGGEVVLVDESGATTTLDVGTERWSEPAMVAPIAQVCRPDAVAVGDRVVVDLCTGLYERVAGGAWRAVEGAGSTAGTCCYPDLAPAGEALFRWASGDDEANDPAAPHRRFRLWVPGP